MRCYIKAFKNYAKSDGYASRKEFWLFLLFHYILIFLFSFIDGFFNLYPASLDLDYGYLSLGYLLISACPTICLRIRRLHDVGKSGVWWLASRVPILSFYVLYLYLKPSVLRPEETPIIATETAHSNSTDIDQDISLVCPQCGRFLPEDSEFCYCCGCALNNINTVPKPIEYPEQENIVQPSPTVEDTPSWTTEEPIISSPVAHPQTNRKAKKRTLVLLLLVIGLVAVLAVGSYLLWYSPTAVSAKAAKNVLYLEVYDEADNCIASGSGFLINDNVTLVTNYHVIRDAYRMVAITADGEHTADVDVIVAYDEIADLAILTCNEALGVSPLILANSDTVKQGDAVYAVGYPLGISNALSDGIISSRYTDEFDVELLQVTAPISNGSSGGALLNRKGHVIGVICASYIDGQNMNLAISSNMLSKLLAKDTKEQSLKEFYTDSHTNIENKEGIPYDFYYAQVRTISLSEEITANLIVEKWQNGTATEESLIELMDEYGASQGGGQLYTIAPGDFIDEIDQWCFDRARCIGDVAIIENPYGFSICYFSGAVERKVFTVGTSADFPPFEYYDDDGDIVGIEILIMYAISEEIGYDFEIVDIPFNQLMTSLTNGEVNCVAAGIKETEDRNLLASASVPFFNEDFGSFVSYVSKDNPDLLKQINRAIKNLQDDGTIDVILDFYLGNSTNNASQTTGSQSVVQPPAATPELPVQTEVPAPSETPKPAPPVQTEAPKPEVKPATPTDINVSHSTPTDLVA